MTSRSVTLSALVLALAVFAWPPVASAGQARQRGGGGQRTSGGGARTGTAAPRGGSTQAAPPSRSGTTARAPSGPNGGGRTAVAPRTEEATAAPAGQGRSRGSRPVTGQAVAREGAPWSSYRYYRPSYYYYPYGGAFGLGYFYYDPFWWDYPYGYGYGYGYPYGYGYGYGSRYYRAAGYGAVKLKVKPKEAEVYVDGYYVGQVSDFDGIFDRLDLEPGPHRIEVRAVGFQPLVFEVRAEPGQAITYRGELQPVGPGR
jgi:hypothetical protein